MGTHLVQLVALAAVFAVTQGIVSVTGINILFRTRNSAKNSSVACTPGALAFFLCEYIPSMYNITSLKNTET